MVRAVFDARQLGMSAMVKPQIWIGGGRFVGDVAMRSDEEWRRFFDAYRRFIVHHAVVAEASGAGLFCVGTELVATEGRGREWRETIAAVRLATGAPLTYASNWAAGAPRVPYWDSLDAIGVDFYDSLSTDPAATDAALEAGVRAAVAPLDRLARAGRQARGLRRGGLSRRAWSLDLAARREERKARRFRRRRQGRDGGLSRDEWEELVERGLLVEGVLQRPGRPP